MGLAALVTLALVWDARVPPLASFWWIAALGAGFYLLGQVCMFASLRHTDASRASPLLTLKVLFLAGFTVLFLGAHMTGTQWLAAVLAVAAAVALNYSGKGMPPSAIVPLLAACVGYSLSDLYIRDLVLAIKAGGELSMFRASILAVGCSYVITGVVALAALPLGGGVRTLRQWPYAVPFAAAWFSAMIVLFACFATIGVVPGNIVQSSRGLISIFLGAGLARLGHTHLEQKVSRWVLVRRVVAAAALMAAIAMFLLSGGYSTAHGIALK
jgi:drug/metabolite transporter (DMT)-like permease